MEAVNTVGGAYAIGNSATCVMLMLDVLERHLDDLAEGFAGEDDAPRHKGPVPVSAAFGLKQVPCEVAAVVNKAIKKAKACPTARQAIRDIYEMMEAGRPAKSKSNQVARLHVPDVDDRFETSGPAPAG